MGFFNKPKPMVTLSRVEKLNEYKKKRNHYYYELIKSIIDGAVNQCTDVIILEKIKGHYPHYSHSDVVIYYDEDIHKLLLHDDIASYADSNNNIVVTVDPHRVSQFKKK